MPYPSPAALQPQYDQYGNQYGVNPLVARSSAGPLAPGQSLWSTSGRISNQTSGTTPVPLLAVPANMVLYITDFSASTVGSAEVDVQVQSGTMVVLRAAVFATCPAAAMFETQPMVIGGNTVNLVASATGSAQVIDFYIGGYLQSFGF